jgi:hypothetical protein
VLYVAGNHEHYDERIGRLHEKLREDAAGSNVVILENETFEFGGYRFFGATLWTDFALLGDRQSSMLRAGEKGTGMNDYRKIRRHDTSRLQPKHTVMLHADSRLALTQFLASGDRTKSVVITHHAPSIKSLPARNHDDLISAAYASNMEELIVAQGPTLWIHGHIHTPMQYSISSTRVINNAQGYPKDPTEQNNAFRRDLVIQLD